MPWRRATECRRLLTWQATLSDTAREARITTMATTDLKHLGFVKTYGTAGVEAVANSKTYVRHNSS